ncbi:acyl-CoA thioester hydrolase/BAAT C-terminal domain-containing protein, partial [Treponema putidum]
RHPEYWKKIKEESKAGGDLIAARKMFEESERRHPVTEEETIKIERIHGKVVCIGAEDDVLWDTCKYIQRMQRRLERLPHNCDFEALTYEHGTHFVFPESMLKRIFPIGSGLLLRLMFKAAREYPKECKETRLDIDRRLMRIISKWSNEK